MSVPATNRDDDHKVYEAAENLCDGVAALNLPLYTRRVQAQITKRHDVEQMNRAGTVIAWRVDIYLENCPAAGKTSARKTVPGLPVAHVLIAEDDLDVWAFLDGSTQHFPDCNADDTMAKRFDRYLYSYLRALLTG